MSRVIKKGFRIYLETDEGAHFYYDENTPPLGQGAMGVVYLGYNYKTRDKVAVKRVKDEFATIPAIRQRAKIEASLMFRHQNLVEMLGYCECYPDRGPIFIISTFVQGETIDVFINHHMKTFSNSSKRICEMILPVVDALTFIHSKKIYHLDIKPSNIMVEQGRNVRLMDLGIVQTNVQYSKGMYSGLMGTPRYAAPEQFVSSKEPGEPVVLNARTDIYELGVTLYELLAKYNPYDANNLAEVKKKHLSVILPYVAGVPNSIIDVLRVATAPNMQDRYENVEVFKQALLRSLNAPKTNIWKVVTGVVVLLVLIVLMFILNFLLR